MSGSGPTISKDGSEDPDPIFQKGGSEDPDPRQNEIRNAALNPFLKTCLPERTNSCCRGL